jgi:glutamate synthase domain-containing protein 1
MTLFIKLDILIKLEHRGAVSADGRTEMEQEFF